MGTYQSTLDMFAKICHGLFSNPGILDRQAGNSLETLLFDFTKIRRQPINNIIISEACLHNLTKMRTHML